MILKVFLLFACSVKALFAEDLPAGVLQTAHAMTTNRDLLKNLPLYTCLATISRSRSERGRQKPRLSDVVHVDVGVGEDQEIYSWPGQPTFSPRGLVGLVGHGFLSTGIFETIATDLFVSGHGIVKPAGEEKIGGRQASHFTYTVPSLESRWLINWYGAQSVLGEEGDFWVDRASYSLLRLIARANTIPPNVPLKDVTTTIDYQFLTVNGRDALLPKQAQVIAEEINGAVLQNDEAFSHCHVFEAESRLMDSSQDLDKALTRYESQRGILPAGLTLRISLRTRVHTGGASIGDPIEARLDNSLKISTETTAPRGSILKGHIREFNKQDDPPNTFAIGLEFDELDWPGHSYVFLADISKMQPVDGLNDKVVRGLLRTPGSVAGLTYSATETFWPVPIPGTATFFL